jgi:hypothetical protein
MRAGDCLHGSGPWRTSGASPPSHFSYGTSLQTPSLAALEVDNKAASMAVVPGSQWLLSLSFKELC